MRKNCCIRKYQGLFEVSPTEAAWFESGRAIQSHGNSTNFHGFVLVFDTFPGGWILRQAVDPSRDPYGNLERLGLESTREEILHCVRRLFLH